MKERIALLKFSVLLPFLRVKFQQDEIKVNKSIGDLQFPVLGSICKREINYGLVIFKRSYSQKI